jgi:outer membrane protein assembly factor BamB
MPRGSLSVLGLFLLAAPAPADDWPQWMGPNRDGVWKETGILAKFPADGPKKLWSMPVSGGYAGPAVADGKVFVADRVLKPGQKDPDDPFNKEAKVESKERVICFDSATGRELWKHEYDCTYQVSYPAGPRCTPTVHDGHVYALGTMGDLYCLTADKGKEVWRKNFVKDLGAVVPMWGFCGHPLIYKDFVITVVGGEGQVAVAFDKKTGNVKWKALSASEPGYCPPTLIKHGKTEQLLIWDADHLSGLNPATGAKYWSVKLKPDYGMSIMAPQLGEGGHLFAAGMGNKSVVLKLDDAKPAVKEVWHGGKETSLSPVNMTPLIDDGVIYGVDRPGNLRAVDLKSGKRLWSTFTPVFNAEKPANFTQGGSGTAFLTKNDDRYFVFNELGTLQIAKLTPKGYEEESRAQLLEPTGAAFGRKVLWSHPAYANKCVYVRNDKELACFSLAK